MALGAVADEAVGILAGEIDRQRDAAGEIGLVAIDQPLGGMQRVEFVGVEDGVAGAEADLLTAANPRAPAPEMFSG